MPKQKMYGQGFSPQNRRVVRVIATTMFELKDQEGTFGVATWLECFRHAGVIKIHRQDEEGICFDILCPANRVSATWAQQVAERMKTFGFNAVSAPEWYKEGME